MSIHDPCWMDTGETHADITSHDTFVRGVPHSTFARLRKEDPVAWVDERDGSGFWAVTRYEDVLTVSRDYATFTSTKGIRLEEMDEEETEARRTLMELDPPEHTRLRRLVNRGFTRQTVESYEPTIRELAREVVEKALEEREFDFVDSVARELPMRMLGRLIGIPDEDGRRLVALGDALIANTDPEFTTHPVDLADTEEYRLMPFRSPAAVELFEYAEAAAAERRQHPRDDLITKMLEPTIDGTRLTDLEFKNFFTLMVAAGNDTTRYSLAASLWMLLHHPDVLAAWRDDPGLSATVVDELLRATTVTMHFRRTATRDTELRGRRIRAGDKVVMFYVSANFDEDHFPEPYTLDPHRSPNDHVTFGRNGPHLCLGAWLARMELRLVFEELLPRIRSVELAGPVERLRSNFISGIKRLPVRVEPA